MLLRLGKLMYKYDLGLIKKKNPELFKMKGIFLEEIKENYLFISFKDCTGEERTIKLKIDSGMGLKRED